MLVAAGKITLIGTVYASEAPVTGNASFVIDRIHRKNRNKKSLSHYTILV